jgi:hypothetical protein
MDLAASGRSGNRCGWPPASGIAVLYLVGRLRPSWTAMSALRGGWGLRAEGALPTMKVMDVSSGR